MLEMLEVGPCEDAYQMGYVIGQRFSNQIRSRLAGDLILRHQLIPFAQLPQSKLLITALIEANRTRFPRYWDELRGTADGSAVPLLEVGNRGDVLDVHWSSSGHILVVHDLQILLLNFRKEILPLVPKAETKSSTDTAEDCSDILVVSPSIAVAAHNEDANSALVGHTYLIKATLPGGLDFTAYTYAGELPTCAFGFNSNGMAFTLNSVPPSEDEIVAGGIGRNFISRDLLETTSMDDALNRIRSAEASVGHSYNLISLKQRKIMSVETASRNRVSVHEVGTLPFFHANMYLHLQVQQVQDESSTSRQNRAASLPKQSKSDFLSLLGDVEDSKYPMYMTGPILYTLCTAVFDLDEQTLSIIEGNPKNGDVSRVFSLTSKEFKEA